MMVTIPHNRIDFGIKACLKNSIRISQESSRVLKRDSYLSLVLYYYSVEEFGKALLLEELKMKSRNGKGISLDLTSHSSKLQKIKTIHNDLMIKHLKIKSTKKYLTSNNKIVSIDLLEESNDDIFNIEKISGQRTSFWLVDYNETTKIWNDRQLFVDDSLREKNNLLRKKIRNVLKLYKKSKPVRKNN